MNEREQANKEYNKWLQSGHFTEEQKRIKKKELMKKYNFSSWIETAIDDSQAK